MENIENFINPPEKAHDMAVVEDRLRAKQKRRERAGIPFSDEERDTIVERVGEEWDLKEDEARKMLEKIADKIDAFLDDKSINEISLEKGSEGNEILINMVKSYFGVKGEPDRNGYYETEDPEIIFQCKGIVRAFRVN